jgi:nitrate reductase NapE component
MTNTKKRTRNDEKSKLEEIAENISWKKAAVILFGILMMVLWPIAGVVTI